MNTANNTNNTTNTNAMGRSKTMAEECKDHWYGPPYNKKRSSKKRWAYNYLAMDKLRRVVSY